MYLVKTSYYTKQKGFSPYVNQVLMVLFLFLNQENKVGMNHLTAYLSKKISLEAWEKILANQQFPIQGHVIRFKFKLK